MNLTNSQKRKILNDAPMGADVVVLSAKGLRVIEYVQEGRGVVSEWSDIVLSLKMLQKEVDAEDKMMAIVEAVDYYRGGDCDWICGEWAYMYNASENGFFRTGSISEHRELVCTIEEFNQCTKMEF